MFVCSITGVRIRYFTNFPDLVCWDDIARAIHLFVSGEGTGLPKDYFCRHKLVGIGHSVGAISILLSQSFLNPPRWISMILVEPMTRCDGEQPLRTMLLKAVESRRDIWPSKHAAFEAFSSKGGFKKWDKCMLKLFCVNIYFVYQNYVILTNAFCRSMV